MIGIDWNMQMKYKLKTIEACSDNQYFRQQINAYYCYIVLNWVSFKIKMCCQMNLIWKPKCWNNHIFEVLNKAWKFYNSFFKNNYHGYFLNRKILTLHEMKEK